MPGEATFFADEDLYDLLDLAEQFTDDDCKKRTDPQTTGVRGGVTSVDLYATRNASGPKVRPRDLGVDGPEDDVCLGEDSESGQLWGASTFAQESDLLTGGKIWMLPAGSIVPSGLAVTPDGAD